MDHEFGYIDDKPFRECDTDVQLFSLITTNDNGIKFEVSDISKFSCLFGNGEQKSEVFAVNDRLSAISAYRARVTQTTIKAIPKSTIEADLYFIEQNGLMRNNPIKHFTLDTKIRELHYYNQGLFGLFFNDSLVLSYEFNKNKRISKAIMNAERKDNTKLGEIETDDNKISMFISKDWGFSQKPSIGETTFSDTSHLVLKFKKGVQFEEAYNYVLALDSVVYLMTLTKWRHNKLIVYDFSGHHYCCKDCLNQTDEKQPTIKSFNVCESSKRGQTLVSTFDNIIKIEKDSINALFPILNYDDSHHSLEISFLEYYKTLEYIKAEENKARGKGKCKTFLFNTLKDNPSLKNQFFGNQSEQEIEKEIRNLRNYYSHTGFYVGKELPIEKDYKVVGYKDIDIKWLLNVFRFIKIATYIEIYKLCGIDIEWNRIISFL